MEITILIWLIVQPYGNLRKEKMCKLFWPLKDLKGSSVWKGSAAGGSFAAFAPLLLNMAIFDLKASSWWIKKEKDITVSSSFFSLLSLFWSLFTKERIQIHMMANICISRKKRNYELQTPSLGDAWFTSSVEVKIAKEQASNEVNLFWLRNFWSLYLNCKYTRLVLSLQWATRDILMISSPHSWSLRSPSRQIHRSSPAGCWSCRHWGHSVRCCTAQWSLSAPFGHPGSASV